MWQRIQTVYLGIAIVAGILMLFLPVATLTGAEGTVTYLLTGISGPGEMDSELPWPVLLLAAVVIIVNAGAVVLFKNRGTQMRLLKLNLLLATGLLVATMFYVDVAMAPFADQEAVEESYGIGLVLPLVIMLLTFLANRAVKKDEALVRSTERLR